MIEVDNVKYFINEENLWRRYPPDNREYRIFRRNKVIKSENERDVMTDEIQFGVGEFFYDRDGNIISYDDSGPKLHNVPIDELIIELERLQVALNSPMLVIEKIPHEEDGHISVVSTETRHQFYNRLHEERRIKEINEKRKGKKSKDE